MRISELLNKVYLPIIISLLLVSTAVYADEPVDIWNVQEKKIIDQNISDEDLEEKNIPQNSVYEMQSKKKNKLDIAEEQTLISKEIKIVGLYDPEENGLDINMWSNSDGNKILDLFKAIDKINLSKDASDLLNILLLTNSYYPSKNISKKEFLKIKSNWLKKNYNLRLIENYLLKNEIINENPELTRYLVDEYLSQSEVGKACEIFSKIKISIEDEYLSKFKIYCLINNNMYEEAQLLLDLKKESGFSDSFFEEKISYLMGYNDKINTNISEESILEFHLSHRTNKNFDFEPKVSTNSLIWKYLSTANLLDNIKDIEITDLDKIATIERATHEKNYTEEELFDLYKRFQFSITQLLNIKESSKLLTMIEGRALIYQGILITDNNSKKIELINALKNSFIADGISNAFNFKMKFFLKEIDLDDVPSNYTRFYEKYTNEKKDTLTKIKINDKIFHQSRLLNYFQKNTKIKNINKDLNEILRKIKRNKKYFFSTKDIILIESLKSDGIKVPEKYKSLYDIDGSEMPSDIQLLIDNGEMGLAMLRIIQVIGQDELVNIDSETMYFIVNTLNQLNVDPIRNQILLKVLPLKV